MTDTSRRNLLAVAGPARPQEPSRSRPAPRPQPRHVPAPTPPRKAVVAYVQDHRSDTIRLMVGEREVVVRDRDLVTRILNAAGGN